MSSLFAGFTIGLSLIVAIGAQNAFILKQGLLRQHVFWVCTVCFISDSIALSAGIAGFGLVVAKFPEIEWVARWAGAAFLFWYGAINFRSAWTNTTGLVATGDSPKSLYKTILLCLAFTWLNPHFYLDTLVMIGSISTQYPDPLMFGVGTISASCVFFYSLGYGARLLEPVFAKPHSWRILDTLIGIIMWFIALSLVA
ncbi:LysE/ArgO family amino acid transporter [Opacimonas viscosa]|uniref:LysE/ArgO family amino acid transporter n=1 Tax=Opacimonas viscosa TaxID=2961944 RepID=A0AA42BMJ0_9ALTE|nr:LysE/ArgO family amino acid transporter [Opacimonas viscosa]MCP3429669.1 LysE/ArgO family amino acid transporter [Opacimonas viscosa]